MPARGGGARHMPPGAIPHGIFMASQFRRLPGVESYEQPMRSKHASQTISFLPPSNFDDGRLVSELQRNLEQITSASLMQPDFIQQAAMDAIPGIDAEFPRARVGAAEEPDRVEAILRGREEGGEGSHLLFPRIVAAIAAASASAPPPKAANEEAARAGGSEQDRLLDEDGAPPPAPPRPAPPRPAPLRSLTGRGGQGGAGGAGTLAGDHLAADGAAASTARSPPRGPHSHSGR
eukprot:tig00001355_g8348.t1